MGPRKGVINETPSIPEEVASQGAAGALAWGQVLVSIFINHLQGGINLPANEICRYY